MTLTAWHRTRLLTAVLLAIAVTIAVTCLSFLQPDTEGKRSPGTGAVQPREQNYPPPATGFAPSIAPSLADLKTNPHALDPAPLALNLGDHPFSRQPDGTVHKLDVIAMGASLNSGEQECEADLDTLRQVVTHYFRIFRQNPVAGENREVIAALTGKNSQRLVFLDPAHPALNKHGELRDRWGTPFRFHPISRSLMEFSSAGPDGTFGTPDDVLLDEEALGDQ